MLTGLELPWCRQCRHGVEVHKEVDESEDTGGEQEIEQSFSQGKGWARTQEWVSEADRLPLQPGRSGR